MTKTITKWQRFSKILNKALTLIGTIGLIVMTASIFLATIFPQCITGFIYSFLPALLLFFTDPDE